MDFGSRWQQSAATKQKTFMDMFDSWKLREASTSGKDINGNGGENSSHICSKMHNFQILKDHYIQHNHFSS